MPSKNPVSDRIEVRLSDIHGHGVFALAPLPAGTLIGRYAGRRYTGKQAAARDWATDVTYAFGLSDGTLIDGGDRGNATRHLNHSCRPNCEAQETEEGGKLHVDIVTLRRIRTGEELFIDYGLQIQDGTAADYPCRCGTRRCRGTMVATGT